jgi:VWFA-related protein
MKYFMIVAVLLALGTALSASQITARYIKTDAQDYPFMISSVQVLDSSDEPIKDLTEANFRLMVDGKDTDSLRTTTYEKTGRGLHVVFCIDASGTMRGAPINSIKNATIPFIEKIRSVDRIAVASYSDDYQLLTDFTNQKSLLKSTIQSIEPKGMYTSLYYGAYKSLQHLIANEDKTGKVLVLMGDGKDENPAGSYAENDVITLARDNGIPIFTIGYTNVELVYLQSLERMAESSGGTYYYAPQAKNLRDHFDKLFRQIMNINLLSYFVVGLDGDGAEHNLSIQVKTDVDNKDLNSKFLAPPGRPAYHNIMEPKARTKINPLFLVGIAAALVILAVVWLLLHKKAMMNRQKRAAELAKQEELERKSMLRAMQVQATIAKEEKEKMLSQDSKEPVSLTLHKEVKHIRPDRERTIISNGYDPVKPVSSSNMLRMEIMLGSGIGDIFTIDSSGATIGRDRNNQIVLPDKTVSSFHAKISFTEGYFIIEDLDSTNGVFINGNKTRVYRLEDSCSFKIGVIEGTLTRL